MAQFLRPDGTLASTNTSITGAATIHEAIDETSVSTADSAWSNGIGSFRVSMTNPSSPGAGTCTIRWNALRHNLDGTPSTDGGGTPTVAVTLYENGTAISAVTKTTSLPSGSSNVADSLTFNTSSISNWNNVELLFEMTDNGGGPNNRDAGVYWAEIEIPDAAVTKYYLIT